MVRPRPEIERALRFIAEHLDEPLTVGAVARAAGLSEFHFQRTFHEAMAETVGQFVARKRLETEVRHPAGKVSAAVAKVMTLYGKGFHPRDLYTVRDDPGEQPHRS